MRFVLVGSQRSGSRFVADCLDSHPDATCHGEVLLGLGGPDRVSAPAFLAHQRRLRLLYCAARSGALLRPATALTRALDDGVAVDGESVVGCRVMYNQIRTRVARYLEADPTIVILHLRRRNLFRQYVSRMVMHDRQRRVGPGSAHVERSTSVTPILIDPRRAHRAMCRVDGQAASFGERFADRISATLWYEDLFSGGELAPTVAAELCGVLGLELIPMRAAVVRTTEQPLDEVVANLDEVVRYFRGSAFESMIPG